MSGPPAERGFALLMVLWLLVPISLMFIALAYASRTEARLAANLRGAAELEAVADGAIYAAIFDHLVNAGADAGAPAGGSASTDGDGDVRVLVEVQSQSGLVNPNIASAELLRALMAQLGTDPSRAATVAAAILDWRTPVRSRGTSGPKAQRYLAAGLDHGPPGAPFESLEELGEVLGMSPDLLAALVPHLTLYWDRSPDPAAADAIVLAALRDARVPGIRGAASKQVIRVTATAQRPDGSQAARRAIVQIGPSPNQRGWRILAWESWQGG